MKKNTILTLTAAFGLTVSAFANIGDTPKQTNARYGAPTKSGTSYLYTKGNWNIETCFNTAGVCAYISYSHVDGSNLSDGEIAMLLNDNNFGAASGHRWVAYSNQLAWWDGGLLYAKYYYETQNNVRTQRTRVVPTLRIASKAALISFGLLAPENNTASTADVNNAI